MVFQYRQPTPCANCPFNDSGPGRDLRDSLRAGRFEGIKADLRADKTFPCHKTLERPEGELVCAGAIRWQHENHCVPASIQLMERMAQGPWKDELAGNKPEARRK